MIETGSVCPNCSEDSFLLFAYGNYRDPLKEIIIHFKFKGITTPSALIARELAATFEDVIRSLNCAGLIPVPLYPSREYVRGYNQAQLYAEQLSYVLALPVDDDILVRSAKRKPQASLRAFERAQNISGVFAVTEKAVERQ